MENNWLPGGLYSLCDDGLQTGLALEHKAARLLEGGVRTLQLRMKRTPLRAALDAAMAIRVRCEAAKAMLLINDRVDLALLSGAHGVHLGDEDLPPEAARKLLGPGRVIGVTARSLLAIEAAARAGADYVGVGPVFQSTTKKLDVPLLGLEGLARLVRESPLPVVAISGIGLTNIAQVAGTGVHGAAVGSDLLEAADLSHRARALALAFDSGVKPR